MVEQPARAARALAPSTDPAADADPAAAYRATIERVLGRALSRLDVEPASRSRGSFDRTWWGWKFTDFSASRFQEGAYLLAWLHQSTAAPAAMRGSPRVLDAAEAALRFWTGLQHADGSFDEAYPFERSLAATAFTGFYLGCALERLRPALPSSTVERALGAIDRLAGWLAANGERHGILSNHLAAAAAALQVAGDLHGTDRFLPARDRYLAIVHREADSTEGWLREYGGADPGYQTHAMFYLAEIWRRTGDAALLERLRGAAEFVGWFAHPDGTVGGEYASRGTKFAYPAAFEILAPALPAAAAVAAHLRRCIVAGRGIGPGEVDSWNLFPLLNNYLAAAEAAGPLGDPPPLPWQAAAAVRVFPSAGLAVARARDRVLAAGPATGGAVKLWRVSTGALLYEDCGYVSERASSQSSATWRRSDEFVLALEVQSAFAAVPDMRFAPLRFVLFRLFTLSIGRAPSVARALKRVLVGALIARRRPHPGRLRRRITFSAEGRLTVADQVTGVAARDLQAVARQVPIHMGSARYVDAVDFLGAAVPCPPAEPAGPREARRTVSVPAE